MKIYFAGNSGAANREERWQRLISWRLLSFWYIQTAQFSAPFAFQLMKERQDKKKAQVK